MRIDNRDNNDLRDIVINKNIQFQSDGSCIISLGNTQVVCAVRYENKVPPFLKGSGKGWVTAEYSMMPGSTNTRTNRNNTNSGRSKEIQRLIGRSLRAVLDLTQIGENSLIDCVSQIENLALAMANQAKPYVSPCWYRQTRSGSRLASIKASSLSVPGVIMRCTCRSTGPLVVAASPTCSQIATLNPALTHLAKYPSAAW